MFGTCKWPPYGMKPQVVTKQYTYHFLCWSISSCNETRWSNLPNSLVCSVVWVPALIFITCTPQTHHLKQPYKEMATVHLRLTILSSRTRRWRQCLQMMLLSSEEPTVATATDTSATVKSDVSVSVKQWECCMSLYHKLGHLSLFNIQFDYIQFDYITSWKCNRHTMDHTNT